jgi:hypothetical protein
MKRETDNEPLLADVFAEANPADFRGAMLGETLRLVRRRRHFRQARNMAGVLIVAGLSAFFLRQNFVKPMTVLPPLVKKITPSNYKLVRTQSLPPSFVIGTKPFAEVQMVTSAATVSAVATTRGNFRRMNDDELLAQVASRPAVLIRTGPNSEELVFADAADQKGFPLP